MCFGPVDSVRLASLLRALTGLYKERAACETRLDANRTSNGNKGH